MHHICKVLKSGWLLKVENQSHKTRFCKSLNISRLQRRILARHEKEITRQKSKCQEKGAWASPSQDQTNGSIFLLRLVMLYIPSGRHTRSPWIPLICPFPLFQFIPTWPPNFSTSHLYFNIILDACLVFPHHFYPFSRHLVFFPDVHNQYIFLCFAWDLLGSFNIGKKKGTDVNLGYIKQHFTVWICSRMWLTSKSSRASIWLCRVGIPFNSFSTVMVLMAPSALTGRKTERVRAWQQSKKDSHLLALHLPKHTTPVGSCTSASHLHSVVCVCVSQCQRNLHSEC